MAPHFSALAWKIPWTEEPGRLRSMGSLRVGHDWATSLSRIGEGHGNPLQWSYLENPRDGGDWGAAVYGVAQRWTRLKWLSSSCRNQPEENMITWRLNNMVIKNQCMNNEIKEEIKTHLETLTHRYTKSMGFIKSSSYEEIHSDTCLHQKGKKNQTV